MFEGDIKFLIPDYSEHHRYHRRPVHIHVYLQSADHCFSKIILSDHQGARLSETGTILEKSIVLSAPQTSFVLVEMSLADGRKVVRKVAHQGNKYGI